MFVFVGWLGWRLGIMQDRWTTVCHTIHLSSSTKPDDVLKRLTDIVTNEVANE